MHPTESKPLSASKALGPEYAGAVWDALVSDPGTGVAILNTDGRIIYANETMASLFIEVPAQEAIGKTLDQILPQDFAAERLELIRQAAAKDRPLLIKSVWKGRRIRSAVHPVPSEDGDLEKLLVVSRPLASDEDFTREDNEYDVVEAKVTDLGDLASLTPREIEVLTLIGQGLSIKQIAELLNRSPKTIENHRHSLGIKLETTNRVQLARIAYEAGLTTSPPKGS